MGCDIHGWIEVDFFGDLESMKQQSWYPHVDISMIADRNYTLFGKLFGVRTDEKGLFSNRGLPKDERTHEEKNWRDLDYENWNADLHSTSHVYQSELSQHMEEIISIASNGWLAVFEIMKSLAKIKGSKNVRLVVWFDN